MVTYWAIPQSLKDKQEHEWNSIPDPTLVFDPRCDMRRFRPLTVERREIKDRPTPSRRDKSDNK